MDTFDDLIGGASGVFSTIAMIGNELVVGFVVAFGLIVWLIAGRGDATRHS